MRYYSRKTSKKARPWDYLYISALCISQKHIRKLDRSGKRAERFGTFLAGSFGRYMAKFEVFSGKSSLPFAPILLVCLLIIILGRLLSGHRIGFALWAVMILALVNLPRMYDWKNIRRILKYFESSWWNNTELYPGEVQLDSGLRGEYKATLFIEKAFERNNIYGKIYNRVLIPHYRNNKLEYSEADIVAVSTLGIHVFEAKNYSGIISGTASSENWQVEYNNGNKRVFYNPFFQNQSHINYLIEELSASWKETHDANTDAPLFEHTANIVFFTELSGRELLLSGEVGGCFVFSSPDDEASGYESHMKDLSARLTKQEVNLICSVMDEMTDYSREEYEARMAEKIAAQEAEKRDRELNPRNTKTKPTYFCCVEFANGLFAVAKHNGDNLWYDIFGEGLFVSYPEAQVVSHSEWHAGEDGYAIASSIYREKTGAGVEATPYDAF